MRTNSKYGKIIEAISGSIVGLGFLGAVIVLGYQIFQWLKTGEWLQMPVLRSVFLARLRLICHRTYEVARSKENPYLDSRVTFIANVDRVGRGDRVCVHEHIRA